MSLHDLIQADAINVFANPNDFAEPVVYYKKTGKARAIFMVVIRDALAILPEDGDTVTPVFQLSGANDIVKGISSEELNLGGDMIAFAPRVGQPVERREIIRLLEHDEGMILLQCR
jgi:hypothetical protein